MGGCFISHSDEQGNGVVSRLELKTSPGIQPIQQNQGGFILPPTFRQQEWHVPQSYGGVSPTNKTKDLLSGRAPGEIMSDEMINNALLADQTTLFNGGIPQPPMLHSGKGQVKPVPGGVVLSTTPRFMFIALTDTGLVDVFEVGSGAKVTSIDVGGTPVILAGYWRQ